MKNAPCRDCADRKVGCHGNCELYKEFKEMCNQINAERHRVNAEYQYKIDAVEKTKRKKY